MRKQKKYHYIYKTTNLIKNYFYIGMHSTNNLEDGYIGSGKRLHYSINKYGKENHKFEILEFVEDRPKLKEREKEIVNEDLLKDPLCINLKIGGEGGWDHISYEHQQNAAKLGRKVFKEKMKNKDFAKIFSEKVSNGNKIRLERGEKFFPNTTGFLGKKHTEESKNKIGKANKISCSGAGNSHYGKIWIVNRELKIEKCILKNEIIEIGWELGRIKDFEKLEIKNKQKELKKSLSIFLKEIRFITLREWEKLYYKIGFDNFCKITGYNKSQPNLCQMFKRNKKVLSGV